MRVNVALCCYKPGREVDRILDRLADCDGLDRIEAVWLVENGYEKPHYTISEKTRDRLKIEHVCLPQKGVSRARQWVVDTIGSGLVIFLDSDVLIDDQLLAAYCDAAERGGAGTVYGGSLPVEYEQEPIEWLKPYLPKSARGWVPPRESYVMGPKDWFMGANFAAFCEDVNSIGGFDTRLGPGGVTTPSGYYASGHESNLQKRLREAGKKFQYVHRARVVHLVPADCCTPAWLLRRTRCNAIRKGLLGVADPARHPSPGLTAIVLAGANAVLSRFTRSDEKRFLRQRSLQRVIGYYEGRKLGQGPLGQGPDGI